MAMAQAVVVNAGTGAVERFDDDARTVSRLDELTGDVIAVRPYTEAENAQADARAAQPAADAEHAATKGRVKQIITDLQAEKDRAQAVLDTANATINASPAKYVKDLAQSAKRTADAVIDLAKYVDGR